MKLRAVNFRDSSLLLVVVRIVDDSWRIVTAVFRWRENWESKSKAGLKLKCQMGDIVSDVMMKEQNLQRH